MADSKPIVFTGTTAEEVFNAYNRAISQLPPEVKQQFGAVFREYSCTLGFDGLAQRLNGKTVAQVLAEIPADELNALVARRLGWKKVRPIVSKGSADEVKALACPKCGGGLSIRFESASMQADGTTAGCLMIHCLKCTSGCAVDGMDYTPSWVESLGFEIETHPAQEA